METYKIVYVEWEDSCGAQNPGWQSKELWLTDPCIIRSVGILVENKDKSITLVPHLEVGNEVGFGNLCIPKSCIKEMKELTCSQQLNLL